MTNISDIAKQLGAIGGQKSVESRLGGKTKEERSEMMRAVRTSKQGDNVSYKIVERTFEANQYPKGSVERTKLNEDIVTSEFAPSAKYVVFTPAATYSFSTEAEAKDLVQSAK